MDTSGLNDAHRWFAQLFELSPDPTWIIDGNRFVECNAAAVSALGYSDINALMNIHPSRLSPPSQPDGEDSFTKAERMMALARENGLHRFEWLHTKADGSIFPAEVTLSGITIEGRQLLYCVWRDISARKAVEYRLAESEQHFRTLANGGSTLIWTSDRDKLCDYFNEPWLRFTGRTLDQELGNGWAEGVHPDDFTACLQTYVTAFDQQQPFSMEYRLRRADGCYRWIRDDGTPRYDSQGGFLGYIGYCMDITEQKEADEKIRNLAFYDPLTGLANRRLFHDRLEKALAASARHGREGALLFIDLDHFKEINDTLGHEVGDRLLEDAARRLESCIRLGDMAARLGGDEFVVMLEYLDGDHEQAVAQAQAVGEKVLLNLGRTYELDGNSCTCTPSIGIAMYLGQQKSTAEVLREADQQMYQVKREGRNALRLSS